MPDKFFEAGNSHVVSVKSAIDTVQNKLENLHHSMQRLVKHSPGNLSLKQGYDSLTNISDSIQSEASLLNTCTKYFS